MKKVLGALSRFMRPKTQLFTVKFRRILKVLCLQGSQINFWAHFHDLCVRKRSCLQRSSDAFLKFYASFAEKLLGAFSRFLRPETKLFAVTFRRILKVLRIQGLQKDFRVHFHHFCVLKWSRLLWNSDRFRTFFLCKLHKKDMGAWSRRLRPKAKLFALKVQTHFGSSLPACFAEKILGASYSRFLHPKMKLFNCREVQTHFGSFRFARNIKSFGANFTIFASKNEAVCREVQTHFWSSLCASFAEKVLGALFRFMCPKMKLFAVKFRRIFEVLCLLVLQKRFWAHYNDFCVQKRSCLGVMFRQILEVFSMQALWKSSGCNFTIAASKNVTVCCDVQTHFGTFPLARFIEKVMGEVSWFMCLKTKLFAVKLDAFWKFSPCKLYKTFLSAF